MLGFSHIRGIAQPRCPGWAMPPIPLSLLRSQAPLEAFPRGEGTFWGSTTCALSNEDTSQESCPQIHDPANIASSSPAQGGEEALPPPQPRLPSVPATVPGCPVTLGGSGGTEPQFLSPGQAGAGSAPCTALLLDHGLQGCLAWDCQIPRISEDFTGDSINIWLSFPFFPRQALSCSSFSCCFPTFSSGWAL